MSSRLVSCAVANLTRRVGGLSLATNKPALQLAASSFSTQRVFATPTMTTTPLACSSLLPSPWSLDNSSGLEGPFSQTTRTMVTRKKRLARRFKRRVEAKRAAQKAEGKFTEKEGVEEEEKAAPQHEAWVDFQKSISVGSFETGQTTKARVQQKGESGQKLRDLKRREKIEMRRLNKRPELADIRGGEYPVGTYSDEETQRLLEMAYAAIPPRAGKRGTRNLKRQKARWRSVRKIHKKHKKQVIAAHYRKMEQRSQRLKEVRMVKEEAVHTRALDRSYQKAILKHWVQNLKESDNQLVKEELAEGEASLPKA